MSEMNRMNQIFGGLQWLLFMFTNTVVIPISVGTAFHLSAAAISASLQRSFVLTGAACLLQAWAGHRMALMEGQSGLWWGVILSICGTASAGGLPLNQAGGALAVGIIINGILLAVLGAAGMGVWLKRLFTPVVMGVFLMLLGVQLSSVFLKGMLGITADGRIHPSVSLLSFAVFFAVVLLLLYSKGPVGKLALLIGITAGWAAYALLFPGAPAASPEAEGALFALFDWGKPAADFGITATAVLAGLLNTTNTAATLRGAEALYNRPAASGDYRRSFVVTGIMSVLSGFFAQVPYAPYTSSLGFLRSTRILGRFPFMLGAGLFMVLGFVPALGRFFSRLPISVGDAVLFVAYLQLFGAALQNLEGIRFDYRTVYRAAAPILLGVSLMMLPPSAVQSLPAALRPLLSNGLLVGILLAVLSENLIRWDKLKADSPEESAD